MREVMLFVEDSGHEKFIVSLIERLGKENKIKVEMKLRSVTGGHGSVIAEFKQFQRDMTRGRERLPDLLVVATDANCKGYNKRRKELEKIIDDRIKDLTVCAIPDPHIERWMLMDSAAFKSVTGKGCNAPDHKCERDRYKRILFNAMQEAGITPPVGGFEYAQDIVGKMDLYNAGKNDISFGNFLKDLQDKFNEWAL
jgi:hypothetical protein